MTTFLDLMPKFATPALCATEGSPDDWHPPVGGEGALIGAGAKRPSAAGVRVLMLAAPTP